MSSTNHRCRQCSIRFTVTTEQHSFYKFLDLPTPQLCKDCRAQRRMSWRNDRTFFIRKSDFSGKQMVSIYPPNTPFPVYHPAEWYSDRWDATSYGRDYDPKRPFLEQWHELFLEVPRLGVDIVNCENSDYCNYCGDDKNCYLDIAGEANEDCYYNLFTKYSKQCVDCTFVYNSELCYESINCDRCYNVHNSIYVEGSSNCYFSFDLKGCSNCLFCSNLRQKQYHIFNQPYSKQEFERKLEALKLDSYSGRQDATRLWQTEVIAKAIHRDSYQISSEVCTGDDIRNCQNTHDSFNITNCRDSRYLYDVLDATDCYDLNYSLYNPERSCELISTLSMKFSACSMASHYCSEVFYCDLCNNSSNLFGCIGLNRQQYCILNKQYSPAEYLSLKAEIIAQMTADGTWGEFFPSKMSPFGYNETVANEYFTLSKKEALESQLFWRETEARGFYDGPEIELPDSIHNTADDVASKVLCCEATTRPYKVILPELQFYRQIGVPVPRRSPIQRHTDRLAMRNRRALWHSKCDDCSQEITTSTSPDSPNRTVCSECYLRLVAE